MQQLCDKQQRQTGGGRGVGLAVLWHERDAKKHVLQQGVPYPQDWHDRAANPLHNNPIVSFRLCGNAGHGNSQRLGRYRRRNVGRTKML